MKMAKASEEDISLLATFFNQWEALDRCHWDVEDWDIEEKQSLPCRVETDNTVQEVDFFSSWMPKIDHRWRRVVLGCSMLIENVCDPDKDYLDYKPELKKLMQTQDT